MISFLKYIVGLCYLMAIWFCSDADDISPGQTETTSDTDVSGYVLYAFSGEYVTHLINTDGDDVKTWTSSYPGYGGYYLSDDLTLLRGGKTPGAIAGPFSDASGVTGEIEELDDNSKVLWSFNQATDNLTLHDDFKQIDSETIIALAWHLATYEDQTYWDENILMIDKETNDIVWQWSAMDDGKLLPGAGGAKDYLHFNSVDYDNGKILVSSYTQSTLYEIDEDSKAITATYTGNGGLAHQHDATFLNNDNILVFNNNTAGGESAVWEIDDDDHVVWSYQNDFYSAQMGGAQALEYGNTLITVADTNTLFEINSDGETVWQYTATAEDNTDARIFKARKYYSY